MSKTRGFFGGSGHGPESLCQFQLIINFFLVKAISTGRNVSQTRVIGPAAGRFFKNFLGKK